MTRHRTGKESLRAEVAARIAALAPAERERSDTSICTHLTSLGCYEDAVQILAYHALGDEVSLAALLEHAAAEGKEIFLPAVDEVAGRLAFRRWSAGDELDRSARRVWEPAATGTAPRQVPGLVLVPGRAFDAHGRRLGRGGGFYDRTLDALAGLGPTIGVAYTVQVVAAVPVDARDRAVDAVATEDGVSWITVE